MDLQISVFLLFALFPAGHALRCYKCIGLTGSCANQTASTCPNGATHCLSSTTVEKVGNISLKIKIKDCVPECPSGSMNLGFSKMTSSCCDTDLCNLQDTPDPPSTTVPNGKKCFYCEGNSCSNTLSCSGTENHCVIMKGTIENETMIHKGCITKSICKAVSEAVNRVHAGSISCCEGNLCNAAQSVSQSFLFLCASLLSYFLMH